VKEKGTHQATSTYLGALPQSSQKKALSWEWSDILQTVINVSNSPERGGTVLEILNRLEPGKVRRTG